MGFKVYALRTVCLWPLHMSSARDFRCINGQRLKIAHATSLDRLIYNVFWLQVPVHDVMTVSVIEGREPLLEDGAALEVRCACKVDWTVSRCSLHCLKQDEVRLNTIAPSPTLKWDSNESNESGSAVKPTCSEATRPGSKATMQRGN